MQHHPTDQHSGDAVGVATHCDKEQQDEDGDGVNRDGQAVELSFHPHNPNSSNVTPSRSREYADS